jgi:hypothetical protein
MIQIYFCVHVFQSHTEIEYKIQPKKGRKFTNLELSIKPARLLSTGPLKPANCLGTHFTTLAPYAFYCSCRKESNRESILYRKKSVTKENNVLYFFYLNGKSPIYTERLQLGRCDFSFLLYFCGLHKTAMCRATLNCRMAQIHSVSCRVTKN